MSIEIEVLRAENQELREKLAFALMEVENMTTQLRGPSALPLDCVAYLTIKHMSNGGLQISGCIGDVDWCTTVLNEALDTVKRLHKKTNLDAPVLVAPNGLPIVGIPARDNEAKVTLSDHAFGDTPPGQRGDMPPA